MFSKKKGLDQNPTNKIKKPETTVSLKMPDDVPIELVQANGLRQYELNQILFAFFATCAASLWTQYAESKEDPLLFSSIVFTLAAILFLIFWLRYRSKLFNGKIIKRAKISNFK
jgi:hypothetical protein